VAVLAKGPVGLLLPVASLGLFVMLMNWAARQEGKPRAVGRWRAWASALGVFAPHNICRSAWQLRPLTAITVVAVVALPWYVLVELRTEGAWLAQFLGEHNLQRALRPFESHSGPFFYYLLAILIGFFPWSVFVAPTCVEVVRRIRQRDAWRAGLILLSCWSAVFLTFYSVVSTKLPHYVLPIYPPLALMTGVFLHVWLTEPARYRPWWMRNAVVTLIVVGVGLLVAMPILAGIFLPGEGLLGLVGLTLVAGGGWCWWHHARGQRRRTVVAFAVTSVAFLTAIFGFAAVRVDRHQNAPSMVAAIRSANLGPTQLAAYRFLKQSFVWYAEQPVGRCENPEDLRQFLETADNPCVFTNSEQQAEIEKEFPGVFYVLARQRRFLHRSDVLVLARRPDAPDARTAAASAAGRRQ
jgi:4-amino-4-deoxy-L-arabinose transferase-like glycosyltransferase